MWLLMYAHLRYALRSGNINVVNFMWEMSWALFHATNKFQYARLTLYVQHVLKNVHDGII